MADADALRALLEKVEAATGPDRELDALLWCVEDSRVPVWRDGMLLGRARIAPFDEAYIGCEWGSTFKDVVLFPHYTSSLDAAVALVERCLPDLEWLMRPDKMLGAFANLYHPDKSPNEDGPCWSAHAVTPALALVTVLLRALLAHPDSPNP